MDCIIDIITNSHSKTYPKYTEFFLTNQIDTNNIEFQVLIFNLNQKKNIKATYNSKINVCDIMGIIDMSGKRFYDFDNNMWALYNKGIDSQISKTNIINYSML